MEEIDIRSSLLSEDLFGLFRAQLKKDFESAGAPAAFINALPAEFEALKKSIMDGLAPLMRTNAVLLPTLLYRIDISEAQLEKYRLAHDSLNFEEVVAELIIKRVLQKIILKKKFS